MGSRSRALTAMILGTACVAVTPLLVRVAEVSPAAGAFWRMAIALPVVWLWTGRESGGPAGSREALWLGLAGLAFAGDLLCLHAAIGLTSVANATFLVNLAPVLVVLVAWPLLGERPGARTVGALALAVAGGGLMATDTLGRAGADARGDGLGLLAAGFFAAYLLLVSKLRRRHSAAGVMLGTCLGALPALALAAWVEGGPLAPSGAGGWAALLGLGLFGQALGQGLTAWALGRLAVGAASLVLPLQPVLTAALAWPLLGEAPGATQALGGAAVLAAVMAVRRG